MRTAASIGLFIAAMMLACSSRGATSKLPPLGPVPNGVRVSTHVIEYPVVSATVDELRREMVRNGPTAEGVRYPGATQWNISWSYQYDRQGARCGLRDVRAVVNARVDVPLWKPSAAPDSAVAQWWTGFQARLLDHEQGHVRLAAQAAGGIVDAIRPLNGGACDALGARANAVGQELLAKARESQAAYDRDTRHGAIPGTAVSPALHK